jgi:uncharacterized protein (DUF4415 family)
MQHNPNSELIDEENPEWTAAMFNEAKTAAQLFPQLLKSGSDVKAAKVNKVSETVFFDADILSAFQATGEVWQLRMNEALREWLHEHAL